MMGLAADEDGIILRYNEDGGSRDAEGKDWERWAVNW